MASGDSFITIQDTVRAELKVRGSRFLGTAIPIQSKEEATAALDVLRKEFWDATHNCYAYRLAPDGLGYRFSDDGEPSGSAGKPILFVLQQRELVNVLVVVTRWFGGTKLGVGGLVRAYTEATQAALDLATPVTIYPVESVKIFTPYEDMRAVRQLVEKYAVKFEEEFRDVVSYTMDVRKGLAEEFAAQLTEVSQGRAGLINLDRIDAR